MGADEKVLKSKAIQGALERAKKFPNPECADLIGHDEQWKHEDIWLGDWGKWQNYDEKQVGSK